MKDSFVIVGMSGGVDSSVTAMLLLEQGFRVEGLFMKNWEETDDVAYCTAKQDLDDAQQVCDTLEIPLHQINFSKTYWDNVFTFFLSEYKAGRTPNPDVMCNKEIKFKAFLEYAIKLGADKIATGHYARIQEVDNHFKMLKGVDESKDQSYFLYELGQKELSRSLFPLGDMPKTEVRELATKSGFDNHTKKDSTGICFIGERKFRDFLSRYLPAQTGNIITLDGEVIGQHQGSLYYTIGQRQGLGIGGLQNADEMPWYISSKNVAENTVTVVQGHDHPALQKTTLLANTINWISNTPSKTSFTCDAKIRYRQQQQSCTVEIRDDNKCKVSFNQTQRAITEGQSVVFYDDEICLGGGIIQSAY